MILVDFSVWIDYFRDVPTRQTDRLDAGLGSGDLAVGDLILAEILQGSDTDREFNQVHRFLQPIPVIAIYDEAIAVQAARNYRALRMRGITVRKTSETLIAMRCIVDGLALLYADRNFDPFVAHLGMLSAME